MYNITIVFSRHRELGKCNSNELYNIFESINPDVIFEEMAPSNFEDSYVLKNHITLETEAIDLYTNKYNIPHIGVDMENIPNDFFSPEYRLLYEKVERLKDINGYTLKSSMKANEMNISKQGFEYLNSLECQIAYHNVHKAIENAVKEFNNVKYNEVLKYWKEIYDKRENEMIKNIYSYCKENSFNQAVFTIGAAHSISLQNKISQYQNLEKFKLIWNIYGRKSNI